MEDAQGKTLKVDPPKAVFLGAWALIQYKLKPGDEAELIKPYLVFDPDAPPNDSASVRMIVRAGTGKYKITYPDTGSVEVEIKAP